MGKGPYTEQAQGERIYPLRAPITQGEREYTRNEHQSRRGRENIGRAHQECAISCTMTLAWERSPAMSVGVTKVRHGFSMPP
eukprot:4456763-Pyramimonas_sp.AAC.1